jgi:hypothetical protein
MVSEAQKRRDEDSKILEKFASNAAVYISEVAEKIVSQSSPEDVDLGLDDHELKEKFRKMKCSTSYKRSFDRNAVFFTSVNEIISTDSVRGGAHTIRSLVNIIANIYSKHLDQHDNGDQIHAAVVSTLTSHGFTAEQQLAAEVLVFYTVNECGIFNEEK